MCFKKLIRLVTVISTYIDLHKLGFRIWAKICCYLSAWHVHIVLAEAGYKCWRSRFCQLHSHHLQRTVHFHSRRCFYQLWSRSCLAVPSNKDPFYCTEPPEYSIVQENLNVESQNFRSTFDVKSLISWIILYRDFVRIRSHIKRSF